MNSLHAPLVVVENQSLAPLVKDKNNIPKSYTNKGKEKVSECESKTSEKESPLDFNYLSRISFLNSFPPEIKDEIYHKVGQLGVHFQEFLHEYLSSIATEYIPGITITWDSYYNLSKKCFERILGATLSP